MSFRKVLIISDNAYLCNEFKTIIENLSNKNYSFDFAISPFSNSKDFDNQVNVYDLKKNEDVKEIISRYELIFSIHCKQIFPVELVENVKCINIHPGYNPINRGWYPQVFSIIHDLPIGATIHEIDNKLDHGPIIAREFVEKYNYDTSESLYNRILAKEVDLLKKYLPQILENKYSVIIPENEGNIYLKKDFNDLLKIDLDKNYTAGELIDKLRALTHGSYSNAYFLDRKTGEKIFVGINLRKDE
jgi:methionyl-tRNA formyltransferase